MEIFQYDFMCKAFVVGILLALTIPCIGVVIVFKRLSMIGDALSHTSLAGVAAGLIMGAVNPVVGSLVACVVAALGIEAIRTKIPRYSEISIPIVLAAGASLAGILSGFVTSTVNFNSFLFGSIVSISDGEVALVAGLSVAVLAAFLLLYKELFAVSFDERCARLAGVPVKLVNFLFTILTALTVAVAARAIGVLMVSSMMVIPVACALQLANSYRRTVVYSIGFALLFSVTGLFLSYYVRLRPGNGLRPGATIVLVGVVVLVAILAGSSIVHWLRGRGEGRDPV